MKGSELKDRLEQLRGEPMKKAINAVLDILHGGKFLSLADMFERPPGSEGTMDPSRWTEISRAPGRLNDSLAPLHRLWHERESWFSGPGGREVFMELFFMLVHNDCGRFLSLLTRGEWDRWAEAGILALEVPVRGDSFTVEKSEVVWALLLQMNLYTEHDVVLLRQGKITIWDIIENAASDPVALKMLWEPEDPSRICGLLDQHIKIPKFYSRSLLRCRKIIIPPLEEGGEPFSIFDRMVKRIEFNEDSLLPTGPILIIRAIENLVAGDFVPEVLTVPVGHRGGEPFLASLLQTSAKVNVYYHDKPSDAVFLLWKNVGAILDTAILKSFWAYPETMGVFHRFMENPDYGEELERLLPRCSLMVHTSLAAGSCSEPFPEL